ncbi:MAG: hypothetical protein R3E42_11015 [Burkholderiaceae bacterium]
MTTKEILLCPAAAPSVPSRALTWAALGLAAVLAGLVRRTQRRRRRSRRPSSKRPSHHRAPVPELVSPTILAYRQDGARHLYGKNRARIFHGQLPPLMWSPWALQVQLGIDASGGWSALDARPHTP